MEDNIMAIELPPLPYARDALAPHISEETLDYHYGKHHASYVEKLNGMISGTKFEGRPLEEVVKNASGAVFNNAAQVWNHSFYWNSLSPGGGGEPGGPVAGAIDSAFGSLEKMQRDFNAAAVANFGSGWTWLVKRDDSLEIVNTGNAGTPLTDDSVSALMTVDVWEHAYYIDYRNARAKYLTAFWELVNWDFVNRNFTAQAPAMEQDEKIRASM
jgi:Fe-Mn family superoxide dismutase